MSQVTYMAPVSEVRGKLTLNRGNDSLIVTRRKSYGKTKNGTPRLGPKEMYVYHKHQGAWAPAVTSHRELFKVAQQQAVAEMNDPERLAHWQALFEEQLNHPKRGEKQYIKLQCYIAAQLLKKLKTQQ
jgi:hypothetical protein